MAGRRVRRLTSYGDEIETRAVLDASAMLSFARGHAHVGELVVMIADEEAYTGLPVVALLDAYARVDDAPSRARLGVLAALDHGAYYLTAEPHLAPSVLPADLVHPIPADDA
ncbi:hypothetical protein I0C86_06355 [Plantactinospora sp. S1510]|uniref:PIN domain-containing protein n=1 Tax=Plantactinospora alkalitolerans TaxID=2789879 RepID=A0ABS0GRA1_9ACTN|nr:hypothetical protein [Plantactinospora alkalitolerans]MBF9128611.1 hypothetical protein [Plantactinospora alkalitolerans]